MNPTKDYIVHEGRIGVPDPKCKFPIKPNQYSNGEYDSIEVYDYQKAFDLALLHTAWFADEEQAIALRLIQKQRVDSGLIMSKLNPPDGLYTVPDMPEWEKVEQWKDSSGEWYDAYSGGSFMPVEKRTILRFVKESKDNAPITSGAHQGEGPRNPSTPPSFIPAVEGLHAKLMDAFHALRGIKGDNPEKTLTLDGIEFSEMIAMCKKSLYKEIL